MCKDLFSGLFHINTSGKITSKPYLNQKPLLQNALFTQLVTDKLLHSYWIIMLMFSNDVQQYSMCRSKSQQSAALTYM